MSQSTTCRTCGASLQTDQRYCLSCGTRITAPRLDFIAEMERVEAAGGTPPQGVPAGATNGAGAPTQPLATASAAPAAAPAQSRLDKIGGPMGAAAVVLVALGVGFLIGQGGDEQPAAQKAPVVNIQGGGLPAAGAATTPSTSDDAAATGGDSGATNGGGTTDAGARRRDAAADAARVEQSTRDIPKSTGSNAGGDINRLRREPIETATPGAPPPRDNEPSGGGSEGTSIG
ncbi:hypothetical protein Q5424_20805 [Conexibacter sp. JD483]|uniref:hypothetical protein n=1 Tax=unclassified Conexibacter TaxID=2627773 RepID=UPI0027235CF2|nr:MULTISPECIES: hypothetical protein [unclassified Conexibacter]MDO8185012.1 hypothetical protein [Conexibacter sp. CPCC 205706]MDO8198156.1 hypothetical protein [Conexibacter sp. CPCC 205762]MDR9371552.1 hypothetical protein [Conexibacter sp. JD483]